MSSIPGPYIIYDLDPTFTAPCDLLPRRPDVSRFNRRVWPADLYAVIYRNERKTNRGRCLVSTTSKQVAMATNVE